MPILYINEEHCTSLEQLRSYFEDSPSYGSPLFYDLLDYARPGDISLWLREKGETVLADQIVGIDQGLGDKEYFSRLSALMTGNNTSSDSIEKPDFSKCFHVKDVHQEKTSDSMKIQVRLKVLSSVNESYEFSVRTSWGQRGDTINPYHEEKDGILTKSFFFRKRPNVEFKNIVLLADGNELKDVEHTGLGGEVLEFEVESCRFKMIRVEHGTFMMGATEEMESNNKFEMPVHEVTITEDFYIGETQVTQKLWKAIMGSNPTLSFKGGDLPIGSVSWDDCQEFIQKLNKKTGKTFRLPTEAEWEFAARGGNKSKYTKFSGSSNWDEVAWCYENSDGKIHPVKTKKANELGIYDMSGNVWEWCKDYWYQKYSSYNVVNPIGPGSGGNHVLRGGSYEYGAYHLSYRSYAKPDKSDIAFSLRLVLSE